MRFASKGIFGWLTSWLFSACMLFAAADTALTGGDGAGDMAGAGDGGGDEGGGGGEGDRGAFGGEGGGDGDLQDDLGDGQGAGGQQQTREQQLAAKQEAALGPEAKKLLTDLKASGDAKQIKLADSIRRALFADREWKNVMPGGIRQAREMRQVFEEVGGADGIRAIQEETTGLRDELQSIDRSWEEADPQFIAGLAEESPEAFAKAAPLVLEQWRKIDKEGYNYTAARIFHNTMSNAGVLNMVSQLWNLANANKAAPGMAGIIEGLQMIGNWAEGIRELAANQPDQKTDLGMKRLNAERSRFQEERDKAFKQEIHGSNIRHLETALVRDLGKFLAQRKIDIRQLRARDRDTFTAMVREAESQLTETLKKDRGFQSQKDRLMQSRDAAAVTRLYQQKIDYLLSAPEGPKIARRVANIFYRGATATNNNAGAARRSNAGGNSQRQAGGGANQGGGGGGTGTVRLSARPDPGTIDYNRTTDTMILDGKGYLKGKKELHQWK